MVCGRLLLIEESAINADSRGRLDQTAVVISHFVSAAKCRPARSLISTQS